MKKLQFLKVGDYMKIITRAKYLDRIIELNGTPDIKIITGIRRSGKSKLMQAYIAYLKSNFENINIIFIDFMDLAYEEIKEYKTLKGYCFMSCKTIYVMISSFLSEEEKPICLLLIDDEEIEDMVQNEDLDYFGLCSSLNATPELMSFKLYSLTKRGQAYHMPMEEGVK